MLAVTQVISNPVVGHSSDSIFIEFRKKYIVVDSIERLGEVQKNTNGIMALLQGGDNLIHQSKDGHLGEVLLTEPELELIEQFLF